MKQRFSYLDLRVIANELAGDLVDCRLQNIYSLEASTRHFLFKFDSKNGKSFVLVDPGYRLHRTEFQHPVTLQPSGFVSKLRKHLKNRRVSCFWVSPGSRILSIAFSDNAYHLVFEFFAGGNILLLDSDHIIRAMYRSVKGSEEYAVGKVYAVDYDAPVQATSIPTTEEVAEWLGKERIGKIVYSHITRTSLSLIEWCLRKHGVDPKLKEGDPAAVREAIVEAVKWSDHIMQKSVVEGFVLQNSKHESLEFEAFPEYFVQQKELDPTLLIESYPTYNQTVDKYFGAILSDKQTSRFEQLHKLAESRLEAARKEKDSRVGGLERVQEQNELNGKLLEYHAELVDSAISAVKQLMDQGMDWVDIGNLINLEKQRGNKVARHISKLDLGRGSITMDLPGLPGDTVSGSGEAPDSASDDFSDSVSDSEASTPKPQTHAVRVKLSQSSWANARNYFSVRRAAGTKKEKTVLQAEQAFKSAQKKIKKDLDANLAKSSNKTSVLHALRQPYWFEKFYWFLSSDGYLVVAGRDALQNQLLLSRYFNQGDILVFCDIPGAALCIIKGKGPDPISPQTIDQAGSFCVSSSKAWETKSGGSAWYISRKNVPRLDAGDPISVNAVSHLSNRSNILPSNFDMGFALLWQVQVDDTAPSQKEAGSDDSSDEFPDTRDDSDEEFPDTAFVSDEEQYSDDSFNASPANEVSASEESSPEPDTELSQSPMPEHTESKTGSTSPSPKIAAAEDTEMSRQMADASLSPGPGSPKTEAGETDSSESEPNATSGEANRPPRNGASNKKIQTPQVRGKNKKNKKLKKYAHQDDEDKLAAMERLGTLKGLQKKQEEEQARRDELRKQLEIKKQRQDRARRADMERIASEVVEDTPYPADLVRKPGPDSTLVSAVPMFGPWSSMRTCTYTVKAIPGQQRKGKVVKEALRILLDGKDAQPTEKQKTLLGGIREPDMQQEITATKLQLSLSGGHRGPAKAKGGANTSQAKPKKKK